MTATYKQRGDSIDYVPNSDVTAGDVVVLGDLVGVTKLDIKANELGTLALTGVFDFPMESGCTLSEYYDAYWDATNGVVTDITTGNKLLGKALSLDFTNDRALVRLSQ